MAGPRTGRPRRLISPLTWRILAVNVTALVLLAAGVVHLTDYRRDLIDAEVTILKAQADGLAAELAGAAVWTVTDGEPVVPPGTARSVLRMQGGMLDRRLQFTDAAGVLVADSSRLLGPGGSVTIGALPPPRPAAADRIGEALSWFDRLVGSITGNEDTSPPTRLEADAESARTSERAGLVVDDSGATLLSATAPVRRFDQVIGAVTVSRPVHDVEAAVLEARIAVLGLAGVTLAVTILVSLYLSRTIVRPLLRLADAAERARRDRGRAINVPELAGRRDEIGDLAGALHETTTALARRLDATERFAADVSHEIKNPLGSIRSAVDTATQTDDPGRLRTLLAIIDDDVRRLDRLITDIADASRLDVELARTGADAVDLRRLLQALEDVAGAGASDRGVTLRVSTDDDDPLVVAGIESRLMQVFDNLVANAVSFSPEGSRVEILASRDGDGIRVFVDDQGPGIPADAGDRIFERFYSHRPVSDAAGRNHSGLGLSLVRQIVEASGGEVTGNNRMRNGTVLGARFTVVLPAVSESGRITS